MSTFPQTRFIAPLLELVGEGFICHLIADHDRYSCFPNAPFKDPFSLTDALCLLLTGARDAEVIWYDEPGHYHWQFIQQNPLQQYQVIVTASPQFQPTQKDKPYWTVAFEIDLRTFCIQVYFQLEQARFLSTTFPTSSHFRFKKALQNTFGLAL